MYPQSPLMGQMMNQPLLVSGILEFAARHYANSEIVSRRVEGDLHRYTFRDCHRRAKRLANALQGLGVRMGERVGTLAWNGYRHLEAYYGVSGSGAVLHTINPRLHPEQLAYICNHAEDQYLLFDFASCRWWKCSRPTARPSRASSCWARPTACRPTARSPT